MMRGWLLGCLLLACAHGAPTTKPSTSPVAEYYPLAVGNTWSYEGTMLFVSHDRHFLAALSNRVLEVTPEGIHQYGGGYTEYVARTGQEAPGLRS